MIELGITSTKHLHLGQCLNVMLRIRYGFTCVKYVSNIL